MTEEVEPEYYYEEETIVEEDIYDEISLLSTIWEESSKDLTVATRKTTASRLRDALAELSIHQSKQQSPSTPGSNKQQGSQTISLGSFLEEHHQQQQDSPTRNNNNKNELPSTTDTKSNDIFRKPLSLDSFVIHTKSPQQLQQQPRYPKQQQQQQFLPQRQHSEEIVSPLSIGDKSSDHDKCRMRLGSFLDAGQQHALVSPPTSSNDKLSLKDAKVALLSLLTGEVVIPQDDDDDEFTYVSYLSEGTSLASETISLVGEDGNKSTRGGSPEKGGPSDTSSQGGSSVRTLKRKSSFGSVSLGMSLGAIAEDDDDDDVAE